MATHCETGGCDNSDCEKCYMPDRRGKDDLPVCSVLGCGRILDQKWDNVGFTAPDPEKWECTLVCPVHGEVDPLEESNDAE